MSEKCRQHLKDDTQCQEPAAFRYAWPGKDESFICENHSAWLRKIADVMGMHLQLIRLEQENATK